MPPAKALRPGDLEKCWQALADSDARKAFAAICDLAAAPGDAVVFLKDWLRPAASLDLNQIEPATVITGIIGYDGEHCIRNAILRAIPFPGKRWRGGRRGARGRRGL